MKLLIKGGKVINPAEDFDKVADILIKDGKIAKIGKGLKENGAKIVDAKGKIVLPGLIDMHVHLREPGREDEETIGTGTRAAARGGFTSIACMPNTQPVIDSQGMVEFIYSQARKVGLVNVYPIGTITKAREGKELSEIGELKGAGAVAISDDGSPIGSSELMRRALEYSKMFDLPVISHCEDKDLAGDGVMHEGYISTILGLPGIPAEAEEIMVARDLRIAELSGGCLHIAHVSTAKALKLIREAKKRGMKVSCETCPHYFTLTDDTVRGFDTNTKMNPPLRPREDVEAVKEGLQDGTIDVIASDHAPHTVVEKEVEYTLAPFGIIGLETSLSLVLNELVSKKVLTLSQAVEKLTVNPAQILRIDKGDLRKEADADITIVDLEREWIVDPSDFQSKSRNTPFGGWKLKGIPVMTIVKGRIVMEEGRL